MARLRIAATDASLIPTPPAGKSTIFLDSDLSFKAKLPNGSLIPISVTEEYLQDIVGNLFQDSSTIDFTYDDVGNAVSMEVIQSALDVFQIPVTPTGNLASDNLGDAINELQSSIDDSDSALQDHLNDPVDAHDASAVSFDNTDSGLSATEVQSAIDEVEDRLDTQESTLATHLNGGASKHDASEIDYERSDGSKNDVQASSDDVESALSDLDDNKLSRSGNQAMTGDLDMDGNNIITGAGTVDGRDVSADGAKLDTIESNAKDDQVASEVPVTPTGNLGSNNVQSGLEELQGDIDTINSEFEERAQDAIGATLQGTSTVELNYDDVLNQISASVPAAGITNAQIASGIDAAKIANGTVSNDEFQRLAGITSNIQTQLNARLQLAGGTMTGNLFLNADPTMELQAATKRYVDNAVQGLKSKDSVRLASTGPLTLASDFEAGDTLDGVVLASNDRILIKNQADQSENGIYIVQALGAPVRTTDADTFDELVGAFVFIEEGSSQANTGWTSTSVAGGTIDVDPIPWVQFSSAGVSSADGEGIEKVGNEFRLELDGGTLSKSATGLKVADNGVDTTQINNLAVTNAKIANDTITNAKIAAAAAIEFSKLQSLLANRALVTDASGVITASIITQTELETLDNVTSNIQTQLNNKTPIDHIDGGASKHDASEIDYERSDGSKNDVQASSDDVESAVTDLDDNKLSRSGNQAMTGNLDMDGNDIITGAGTVDGRDVSADGAKLDTIESNAKDDQVASEVPVTPVGNVVATDVQAAIQELDSEKVPNTREVNAGTGLSGGGDLSADRTINMPSVGTPGSYGSATQVPVVTTDTQGRVSNVVNTPINGVPAANIVNTPAGNIAAANVQDAINELDSEKQPLDGDLTAVANLSGTGLVARTATNAMTVRTIQAAAGETTVSNGDGVSGNPTVGLPNVGAASSVGAANQSLTITTDAKGRITSKIAQAISIVSSQVTDFATTVRNTVLTGYVVGSSVAIAASDTILQAFGKVQAQLNTLFNRNINTGTGLQGGGNLTADRTLSLTTTGVAANTYGNGTNVGQFTVNSQGRLTAAVDIPITFGRHYTHVNSEGQSQTNSTTFQTKLTLTTPTLTAGDYRIQWYYNWSLDSIADDFEARIMEDGTTQIMDHKQEPQDSGVDQTIPCAGFRVRTLTAGVHTFTLQFRTDDGAVTAYIRAVRMEIWRIS